MRIGACLITTGTAPEEPGLKEMAQRIERAGASSLWVNDHLAFLDEIASEYPYSRDGLPTWEPALPHYESLSSLSYAGAVTDRVRLGTAVLILPQRNVIQLAKTAASIDRLTGGRLVLGVGIGWQREEMEVLGYPFDSRVQRAEEMIVGLRSLWTGRTDRLEGEEVDLPAGVISEPRPLRETGVPIYIGGMVSKAIDRAARLGDGWVAVSGMDQLDVPSLAKKVTEVHRLRREYGRDAREFQTVLRLDVPELTADGACDLIWKLLVTGFDELALELNWSDPDRAESVLRESVLAAAETMGVPR
jgi:probable F420-dependent oxidoreductase